MSPRRYTRRMAAPLPRTPGSRILVVDDSVDSAETLGELLKIWGHDVRLAHDGPGAVAAAREYRPEVVLLDIGLPGMDGFAVATQLRKEGLGGRMLVALTGYGEQQDQRPRAAGRLRPPPGEADQPRHPPEAARREVSG